MICLEDNKKVIFVRGGHGEYLGLQKKKSVLYLFGRRQHDWSLSDLTGITVADYEYMDEAGSAIKLIFKRGNPLTLSVGHHEQKILLKICSDNLKQSKQVACG